MLPVTSTDSLSLWLTTHSHTVALWLLPSMAFLLQIQSDCGTKLSPVSQNPPTALYASARPSLCVPSSGSLCAGLGGLLWNVVRRRGWVVGGGEAGLKGGAQFFPHTASTPHWYVTHLTIWGRQSKGHTEIELVTLKTNTRTHACMHTPTALIPQVEQTKHSKNETNLHVIKPFQIRCKMKTFSNPQNQIFSTTEQKLR